MQEDLKESILERLEYNPETGVVISKINYGRHFVGKTVGTPVKGRIRVIINKRSISLTKVIWVLVHGRFPHPGMEIDHVNRDPMDNRLVNLQEITVYANRAAFDY